MDPPSLKLLYIEDHSMWIDIVRIHLQRTPEYALVAVATTGAEGIALARQHRPAVVLLDLWLPDCDGFTLVESLQAIEPMPRLLLFTGRQDEATLYRIERGNFAGVIWKDPRAPARLTEALGEIHVGRSYFPPDVRAALRHFRTAPDGFFKRLSDTEISLLGYLGYGLADAEIGERTGLAASTVKSHRKHIMQKLDLHSTADLMRWSAQKGFGHLWLPGPPCAVPR